LASFELTPFGPPAAQGRRAAIQAPAEPVRKFPITLSTIRRCRIAEIVIAEIVSLPGYESQASELLREDERMAMEFFIACAPESHPLIPATGGFRRAR
jgi:hypothetical protein